MANTVVGFLLSMAGSTFIVALGGYWLYHLDYVSRAYHFLYLIPAPLAVLPLVLFRHRVSDGFAVGLFGASFVVFFLFGGGGIGPGDMFSALGSFCDIFAFTLYVLTAVSINKKWPRPSLAPPEVADGYGGSSPASEVDDENPYKSPRLQD